MIHVKKIHSLVADTMHQVNFIMSILFYINAYGVERCRHSNRIFLLVDMVSILIVRQFT